MKEQATCNIALVAESTSGVGKTVLCERFIKKAFLDPMNSDFSVEVSVGTLNLPTHEVRLNIYNIPGRDTYRTTAGAAPVSQAQGIMLVYDVTDRKSFESLGGLYTWVLNMKRGHDFSLIVVGTKTDLVKQRTVPREVAEKWCRNKGIDNYFEVSGKTGDNVDKAFECLGELALWTRLIPSIKDGMPTQPNICVGSKNVDKDCVLVPSVIPPTVGKVFKKLRSLSIWFDDTVEASHLQKFEECLVECPTLGELIIGGKIKPESVAAFYSLLAAVIRKSTSLQALSIQGHTFGASRARGIALVHLNEKRSSSSLVVDLPREGLAFDDKGVIDAIKASASLRSICFACMSIPEAAGPLFADTLIEHKTLQTLCFRAVELDTAAASKIFNAMKGRKIIRNLELRGITMAREAWTAFVEFMKMSNLYQLCLSENTVDSDIIRSLVEAIKPSTSLHALDLSRVKIDKETGRKIGEMLAVNTSLQKLFLEKCGLDTASGVEIANAMKTNICLQNLRLTKNGLGTEVGRAFIAALKFNSSLTAIDLFGNDIPESVVSTVTGLMSLDAVTERQRRKEADTLLFLELAEPPVLRPKLFLCGSEGCGKTTLVNTLKRTSLEGMFTPELHRKRMFSPKDRTVGIEVQVMKLPSSPDEFCVWDLSGEHEYLAMHEYFIADETAIFVVVCSLELDETHRERSLLTWLTFIKSRFETCEIPPQVILVGTCADTSAATVKKKDLWTSDWGTHFLFKLRAMFSKHLDIVGQFYAVDARKTSSANVKSLRECLHACHKATRQRTPRVPKVCPQVLESLPLLREAGTNILTIAEFRAFLKRSATWVTEDQVEKYIQPLMRYLHNIGEIVWFEDDEELRETVVVNPHWLCSDVMGAILAPPSFVAAKVPKNCGSISKEDMDRFFKGQDVERIVSLLCKMGLCFVDNTNPKDISYNFPASLLDTDVRPDGVWAANPFFDVYFGRRWLCSTALDIFTVGFFPRFQVFAMDALTRHAEIWKNGLVMKVFGQYECMVQMAPDALSVDIWVRCGHKAVREGVEIVHKMLEYLERAHAASCSGTVYNVLALSPADMKADTTPAGYPIDEVRRCGKDKTIPKPVHPASAVSSAGAAESPAALLGPLEVIVESKADVKKE